MGATDGRRGSRLEPVLLGDQGSPSGRVTFVGTVNGDEGTPLNGVKVQFTITDRAELSDREGNPLGSWALLDPPIPHRSGYYLRTADHGLVLAQWCHECNGQVKAGTGVS